MRASSSDPTAHLRAASSSKGSRQGSPAWQRASQGCCRSCCAEGRSLGSFVNACCKKSAQSGGTLPGKSSMSAQSDKPADSSLLSSCRLGGEAGTTEWQKIKAVV